MKETEEPITETALAVISNKAAKEAKREAKRKEPKSPKKKKSRCQR